MPRATLGGIECRPLWKKNTFWTVRPRDLGLDPLGLPCSAQRWAIDSASALNCRAPLGSGVVEDRLLISRSTAGMTALR